MPCSSVRAVWLPRSLSKSHHVLVTMAVARGCASQHTGHGVGTALPLVSPLTPCLCINCESPSCAEAFSTHDCLQAAGLLNGDDHDLVAELVGSLISDYEAALGAGQRHRARMLLRFMAALVVVNVVQPSDVLTVLEAVVASAIAIAEAGADPQLPVVLRPAQSRESLPVSAADAAHPPHSASSAHGGSAVTACVLP